MYDTLDTVERRGQNKNSVVEGEREGGREGGRKRERCTVKDGIFLVLVPTHCSGMESAVKNRYKFCTESKGNGKSNKIFHKMTLCVCVLTSRCRS